MTSLLIKLFVKNSDNPTSEKVRARYANLGSFVGIFANLLLSVLKITIGLITASLSIVADGLNNLSDMGSSIITVIGFKLADKPADRDHPFGHGRMEYISAFVISFLILLVGFELFKNSIAELISGNSAPEYSYISIAVLVLSIAVKLWMFLFNRKIGKTIDSSALVATSKDSLNDCVATGAILIAALLTKIVHIPFNIDAVMSTGVALFILWSGFCSVKETVDEILGGPPSPELIKAISDTVMSFEQFDGIHDLIVHNYGPGRQFASVHVEVPQNTDIVACHERIDLCEKLVFEKLGVNLVIHMDPIDTDNATVNDTKQKMIDLLKSIDGRLNLHDFRMTPSASTRTNLIFDVVVPSQFEYTVDELNEIICQKAREINETYVCVITFDSDFTGN